MTATKPAEINWKRNLFFIWSSQVLSLMAFSFAMSFAAYYIQDLGITDPKDVKFWNGAFAASAPLAMAVMGPIWGIIGDRVGRRPMMLRAYFCATVIIFLMGRVTNVHQLIVLRVAQGAFTGTMIASTVMVAVMTPKHRQCIALGSNFSLFLYTFEMRISIRKM